MTNEQAIYLLKGMRGKAIQSESEALDMAIEALNFVSEHHQSNIETYAHDMGVSLEQAERELRVDELSCSEEPNRSDTIYRQEAIDEIEERKNANGYRNVAVISELNRLEGYIMRLPSAQPEIIRCKDCKDYQTDWEISHYPNRHFCATMDSTMPEDGFCSYAERKDNG